MLEFQLFYFYIVNKGTLVYQVDWFKDVYLRSIANGNKMQSKKTKALVVFENGLQFDSKQK